MQQTHVRLILVFLTANFTFLVAVACALIAVSATAFLQPDPLEVVVEVPENFVANQSAALTSHILQVRTTLDAHTNVLTRLTAFLSCEET